MMKEIQLTSCQQHVLNILRTEQKAMSAYELLARSKEYGVQAPMQIYRILKKLTDSNLVLKLSTLNMYLAYEIRDQQEYHLFTICMHCQQVQHESIPQLGLALQKSIQKQQFISKFQYLEILGQCDSCTKQHNANT